MADRVGKGAVAELKRPWTDYMASRGLHFSKAREQIVEAFLGMRGHVGLADILARVRECNPNTSFVTVYRTVKLLEAAGIACARRFSDHHTVFEVVVGREQHDHLICERCGEISEFADPDIERLQTEIARLRGFVVHRRRHELFGLCAECRSPGPREAGQGEGDPWSGGRLRAVARGAAVRTTRGRGDEG